MYRGQWVYGNYVYCLITDKDGTRRMAHMLKTVGSFVEIDEKTLCEFITILPSGQELYEGDVISATFTPPIVENTKTVKYKIRWDDETAAFLAEPLDGSGCTVMLTALQHITILGDIFTYPIK